MKYFALKVVMYVYYLIGVLLIIGATIFGGVMGDVIFGNPYRLNGFSSAPNTGGILGGGIVGLILGAIVAVSFFAFAQLIQLILDMKAEQSEQTKLMQFQANALKKMLSDR